MWGTVDLAQSHVCYTVAKYPGDSSFIFFLSPVVFVHLCKLTLSRFWSGLPFCWLWQVAITWAPINVLVRCWEGKFCVSCGHTSAFSMSEYQHSDLQKNLN